MAGLRDDAAIADRTRDPAAPDADLPGAPSWGLTAAIGLACAGLALAIRWYLESVGPLPGDLWTWHAFSGSTWNSPLHDWSTFFSVIGTPEIALTTVALITWFSWQAAGPRAAALVLLAAAGVVLNIALKELSGPTPEWKSSHPNLWLNNFPSGHVVYATTVFGAAAWLAWPRRRDISAVLLVLILAMGPFRVFADAHYLSDVIAGYAVGLAWLVLAGALALPRGSRLSPG